MSQIRGGIHLDADALRDEIEDRESLTQRQADALAALPNNVLNAALDKAAGDEFWQAYDDVRGDAIRYLLREMDLGVEGED